MNAPAEKVRALRKRHERERQAVVFGSLLAGLGVLGLGATAVYTEVLPAPFLERDFSTEAPAEDPNALPPAPCPPEGTLPVAYNAVTINVLNASSRAGLAGQTATELAARGFVVGETANSDANTSQPQEIRFGEAGIGAAYTLASQFLDPVLALDTREDATVDLLLGDAYPGLLDPATVVLDPGTPLVGVAGCVALSDARAAALPGPTPSPSETAATEGELQDGGEGAVEAPTEAPAG